MSKLTFINGATMCHHNRTTRCPPGAQLALPVSSRVVLQPRQEPSEHYVTVALGEEEYSGYKLVLRPDRCIEVRTHSHKGYHRDIYGRVCDGTGLVADTAEEDEADGVGCYTTTIHAPIFARTPPPG